MEGGLTMNQHNKPQDNQKVDKIVEKEYYPGIQYQELFNHLSSEHGLTLLQSEMDEIINICGSMGSKQRIAELEKTVNIQDCAVTILSDSVAELEKQNEQYREALDKIKKIYDDGVLTYSEGYYKSHELAEQAIKDNEI